MSMFYDNGDSNTGTVSGDCKSFSWGWEAGTGGTKVVPKDKKKCVPHGRHPPGPPPGPPGPPPPEPYADIKVVHVINSCHLDIGFADSSQVTARARA